MKQLPLNLILCCVAGFAVGQSIDATPMDTLNIHPNTIRISGQVISSVNKTAVIKIDKIIGAGSGIINMLSEGEQITISLPEDEEKLVPHEKITADLKEKLGSDASSSAYTATRVTRKNRG